MNPNRDVLTPNRDVMNAKCVFLLKREPSAHTAPRTRSFINLHDDRHAWSDRNSLIGIDRQSRGLAERGQEEENEQH